MSSGTGYELLVQRVYQALVERPELEVRHNVVLTGRSGATHQIDVMWSFEVAGVQHTVLVECKDRGRPREKGEIALFKGVLDDLRGKPQGLFVSRSGFQSGAELYAKQHDIRLLEIRAPNESDWMPDELLEIHVDLQLWTPSFDVIGLDIDLEWLRERLPPGTSITYRQEDFARSGPELTAESGEPLGGLAKVLASRLRGLPQNEVHTVTFAEGIYIETGNEMCPRAPLRSCTFSYTASVIKAPLVVDFRRQVELVVNDIIEGTQIRLDKALKASPKIERGKSGS